LKFVFAIASNVSGYAMFCVV